MRILERPLLEVDDGGHVHREIGVDAAGQVVYIAPALRGPYPHGMFDLQVFGAGTNPEEEALMKRQISWIALAAGLLALGWTAGRAQTPAPTSS